MHVVFFGLWCHVVWQGLQWFALTHLVLLSLGQKLKVVYSPKMLVQTKLHFIIILRPQHEFKFMLCLYLLQPFHQLTVTMERH